MLDQESESTFISESVVQLLRLQPKNDDVTVSDVRAKVYDVSVILKRRKYCAISISAQAFVVSEITAYVPTMFTLMHIPSNLCELDIPDLISLESNERIDLLIGVDLLYLVKLYLM